MFTHCSILVWFSCCCFSFVYFSVGWFVSFPLLVGFCLCVQSVACLSLCCLPPPALPWPKPPAAAGVGLRPVSLLFLGWCLFCAVPVSTVFIFVRVSCLYCSLSPLGPLRMALSYIALVRIFPLSPVAGLGPSRYCYYCTVYAACTVL